jgi:hypothetical protein
MLSDFDQFWAAYPRKIAKADARKAWAQMAQKLPPVAELLSAISVAKESEQWRKDSGLYIPYPATWLRGERWEDCYEAEITPLAPKAAWWTSDETIMAYGKEKGINPRPGETMRDYKARLENA